MENKFIKIILKKMLWKKMTTALPFIRESRSPEMQKKDIEDFIKQMNRDGYVDAYKESGQDPEELVNLLKESFKELLPELEKLLFERIDSALEELKKEISK